ncbi:Hypothetical predicted protein [Mytilus galloprovincialis]|uniref:Uncharacterized protein n=1 Tax=Mytilus galloprovincialis TaxID=29158 RepID=A0A8B6BMS4_MYTGA|nr:Hypothetical predicted protein [Mytilus galloprovincialis]
MRGLLQSAIGTIKSKITEIDHEIEISKSADNNHYKLCTQWKEEIKTHAKRSKETVCRIIDVLADLNLHSIDEMMNRDIKSINNFQDELETKKLSLHCLLKSTNDIVKQCGDGKLLTDYAFLYNTLQNAVTQENRLMIFAPQFCFGNPIERKCIEKWFGLVTRREKPSTIGTSEIQMYSLPVVCNVTEFTKKSSFTFEKTRSLFGTCENKAWIHHMSQMGGECIQRYSTEDSEFHNYGYKVNITNEGSGFHNYGYKVNITNEHHILRATLNELWIKCGELIKKITVYFQNTEEIVRMPRSEKDTCCVFDDNRVVTYCVRDNCFNVVNIDGNWPVTLNKTTLKVTHADIKLRNFITTEPFMLIETCLKRIILTCQNKVVTLDKNFRICHVHENKGSDFRGICGDPYGNIFIVDYNLGKICLFNSNGNFLRNVSVQGISSPVDITRDSVGNIWLADKKNQVHILSYL